MSSAITVFKCKLAFEAIGTSWEIETAEPLAVDLRETISRRIERFDAVYSRFRADSIVTKMACAERGGRFEFPNDAARLFDLYDRLHEDTCGAVDPLVGRDLELLGYDRSYSLRHDPLAIERYSHARHCWRKDVRRQGSILNTQRPVVIDVGAAGKGYLVDIVADILRGEGIQQFIVDASGDMFHQGSTSIDVGLEHPFDPGLIIGIAHLHKRALCASAVNRRAWGPFHHVVDGRTGLPVRGISATWVIADNAISADGLATALFFQPGEELADFFEFSYVRMFADGTAEASVNFNGELF